MKIDDLIWHSCDDHLDIILKKVKPVISNNAILEEACIVDELRQVLLLSWKIDL